MDWQISPAPGPLADGPRLGVITLRGDFDLYEGPRFAAELLAHIRAGNPNLVFDLGAVDYLDSCGVGIIIKLLQESRLAGGRLKFRGIHGSPRRVLEMSNVIRLLDEIPAASTHNDSPPAGGRA